MKFIPVSDCYAEPLEGISELVRGKSLMTEGEQKFFLQFMKEDRPKKILEVGTNVGGTTAVILHAMEKLKLDAQLHSVDLGDLEKTMRETVVNSLGVVCPDWNQNAWHIHCKITVAGVIEDIGRDIDFCVLDAAHTLPGEVLDFLAILPFLKDGTVVVLHDICFASKGLRRTAIATNVLFSSVVATEKYLPLDDGGNIMNIAAFRVGSSTRTHIHNVIQALSLPWAYTMEEKHENDYKKVMHAHYPENEEFFLKSLHNGKASGTKESMHWDFDKEKNLLTQNGVLPLDETNDKCIVFWGNGHNLKLALQFQTPWYFWRLLSDQKRAEYAALRARHHVVDTSSLASNSATTPTESIQNLGDRVAAVVITPGDIVARATIKQELANIGIEDEKIFTIDEFILGEKESLNYPTGHI